MVRCCLGDSSGTRSSFFGSPGSRMETVTIVSVRAPGFLGSFEVLCPGEAWGLKVGAM